MYYTQFHRKCRMQHTDMVVCTLCSCCCVYLNFPLGSKKIILISVLTLNFSSSLQCCDLGYQASLARAFRTYLSAEYNLETSRHEGLDIIENAVDNLDARSDKHKLMDIYSQVFCPPMRFEYLPHMGDEVSWNTFKS